MDGGVVMFSVSGIVVALEATGGNSPLAEMRKIHHECFLFVVAAPPQHLHNIYTISPAIFSSTVVLFTQSSTAF